MQKRTQVCKGELKFAKAPNAGVSGCGRVCACQTSAEPTGACSTIEICQGCRQEANLKPSIPRGGFEHAACIKQEPLKSGQHMSGRRALGAGVLFCRLYNPLHCGRDVIILLNPVYVIGDTLPGFHV